MRPRSDNPLGRSDSPSRTSAPSGRGAPAKSVLVRPKPRAPRRALRPRPRIARRFRVAIRTRWRTRGTRSIPRPPTAGTFDRCSFPAAAVIIWTGSAHASHSASVIARPLWVAHAFPSTRSTTQHPRTCGPFASRQWLRMSSLSQPASWSASARIGIAEKSRDSYI